MRRMHTWDEIRLAQQIRTVPWSDIPESLRYDSGLRHPAARCQAAGPMTGTGIFERCLVPTKRGQTFCHRHRPRIVRNVSDPEEISRQWEAQMKGKP